MTHLFDNSIGFKPTSDTLNWWAFLPQVSSDKKSPSIFGTPKSTTIPTIMVGLLVILELLSLYILQEEGAIPIGLVVLMIADFIIALVPLIKVLKNYIDSIIINNIFIREIKLKNNYVDENEQKENYHIRLRNEIKIEKSNKFKSDMLSFTTIFFIIVSAGVKYYFIDKTFGDDTLVLTAGRVSIALMLISAFIHIAYTTNVIAKWIFNRKLKKELDEFNSTRLHKHNGLYTTTPIYFKGKYSFVKAGNQVLGKILQKNEIENENSNIVEIKDSENTYFFDKTKSESNDNVFLCHFGLLTDPEIYNILSSQSDYKENILAIAREIQIETTK